MHIKLPTCTVRSWEHTDIDSLAFHANNRKIWLNLRDAFPHPYSNDDARAYISSVRSADPETTFAIEVDGEACGSIGLRLNEDVERCSAEIGCWLGEKYWGRGISTEVLKAITDYAMDEFNLNRVYALPYEWNAASCRMLEKVGYEMEGRLRKSAVKDGRIVDQLLYAFVKPE